MKKIFLGIFVLAALVPTVVYWFWIRPATIETKYQAALKKHQRENLPAIEMVIANQAKQVIYSLMRGEQMYFTERGEYTSDLLVLAKYFEGGVNWIEGDLEWYYAVESSTNGPFLTATRKRGELKDRTITLDQHGVRGGTHPYGAAILVPQIATATPITPKAMTQKVQVQTTQSVLKTITRGDSPPQTKRKILFPNQLTAQVSVGEVFIVLLGLVLENGDYYWTEVEGEILREVKEPLFSSMWHQTAFKAVGTGKAIINVYKGNSIDKARGEKNKTLVASHVITIHESNILTGIKDSS